MRVGDPKTPRRLDRLILCSLAVLLPTPPLLAQVFAVEAPQIHEGWHTVRPGDTLESITAHYLGTSERWRENWELNAAEVADPHRIYPGQRLRVLIGEELPADGALLFKLAREVKDQLLPFEWDDARKNELLRSRDQVRTLEDASAQLLFYDNTHLILTELSLVTVGEGERVEPQVERAQIEIVLGQADLAGKTRQPAAAQEIEILVGGATAKPRPDSGGVVETRARRPEAGGAQVMVFAGSSELEAAGTRITVPQGMGSAVPEGKPPAPPEKLLDPPSGLEPAAGSSWPTRRPELRWDPVDGARSYTVEVCVDASCGQLVERGRVAGDAAAWQPGSELPVASLYWRVTATSASGLDGFPSAAVPFEIVAGAADEEPPRLALRFVGPQDPPRSGFNEQLIVGPGIEIEVEAEDSSGIRDSMTVLDGRDAAPGAPPGPWARGGHRAAAWAVDRAGNRAETETVPLIYDPDPPRFRWGIEGDGVFREVDPSYYAAPRYPPPARRGRQVLTAGGREWFVDSDFTQVILRPLGWKGWVAGVDKKLRLKRGLWILAEDEICPRVETLSYDIVERPEAQAPMLVVEAVDCVGNRARIEWPLAKTGS